jgi:Fur family ferric uptake transcriptional regulator
MGCENQVANLLREAGHKLTPQRMMIVSACRHAGGHRSAAEILADVRKDAPYVDASTVYRTLSVLKELRLVTETDLGEGETVSKVSDPAGHGARGSGSTRGVWGR